jgi:hypothetical protein
MISAHASANARFCLKQSPKAPLVQSNSRLYCAVVLDMPLRSADSTKVQDVC